MMACSLTSPCTPVRLAIAGYSGTTRLINMPSSMCDFFTGPCGGLSTIGGPLNRIGGPDGPATQYESRHGLGSEFEALLVWRESPIISRGCPLGKVTMVGEGNGRPPVAGPVGRVGFG